MRWQLVFFSMAPVLAFALARPWVGMRQALLVSTAVAALELALSSAQLGFLEPFSLLSLALFAGLSWLADRRNDVRWFQAQPVVLETTLALVFLYDAALHDASLLRTVVAEGLGLFDWLAPWRRGYWEGYVRSFASLFPFVLLAHAGLTAWAARRLSFRAWVAVRIAGFYLLLAAVFFAQRLIEALRQP